MLDGMRRRVLLIAVASLTVAMPSAAQVGSGRVGFTTENGVYTMDPDGRHITRLRGVPDDCYEGSGRPTLQWSPDGSAIAFQEDGSIKVMGPGGGDVRTISGPLPQVCLGGQTWSPTSHELTFALQSSIWVAGIDGSTRTVVTGDPTAVDAAWSPTGASIAYVSSGRLRLVDLAGGPPRTIAAGSSLRDPVWFPDGRRIAFERSDGVWIVTVDGSGLRHVSTASREPAVSPDGSKLLFEKAVGQYHGRPYYDTYVADTSTLARSRLTFEGAVVNGGHGGTWAPNWSPDGSWITTESGLINADGTCPRPLGPRRGRITEIFWQPVPGRPPLAEHECRDLRLTVTSRTVRRGTGVAIAVTVANSGTETVSRVRLRPLSGTDFTVTSARSRRGSCSLSGATLCRLGSLRRGQSARLTIGADGRRARGSGGWPLLTTLSVEGDEAVLARFTFATTLGRCTTRTRGGGLITGTAQSELICGRRGPDRIDAGEGRDVIRAGAGDDVVLARDEARDVISCGPGRDLAFADRKDQASRDCERIRRS